MVAIRPQHGQRAPLPLIVPAPLSASATPRRTPNSTPEPSARGVIVSNTRLLPLRHNHSVLSRGISARQLAQRAVRAHRYATGGFSTQRGFVPVSRYSGSNSALSAAAETRPRASGSSRRGGRGR